MAKSKVDYHSHSSFNYALFITELLANVTEKEIKALSTTHPSDLKEYTSAFVSFTINAIPLNIEDHYYEKAVEYDLKATEIKLRYGKTDTYNVNEISNIIKELSTLRKEIMKQTKLYWNRLTQVKTADEILKDIAVR